MSFQLALQFQIDFICMADSLYEQRAREESEDNKDKRCQPTGVEQGSIVGALNGKK
jgi:hypothetical protein